MYILIVVLKIIDTTRQNLENRITSLTGVDTLRSNAFSLRNQLTFGIFLRVLRVVSIRVSQTLSM
jgi:hypothetical protein